MKGKAHPQIDVLCGFCMIPMNEIERGAWLCDNCMQTQYCLPVIRSEKSD